ncbi:hypothetical protein J2W95_002918 [Flavobacterium granuli]|uniref:Uncharacterized protein n=1 Tax=Flavobacterium granuli TaxID=280093 RepID=A0ABU1S5L2_9FLAO|nr:hypothetical protein [Flavobacterium granuli]
MGKPIPLKLKCLSHFKPSLGVYKDALRKIMVLVRFSYGENVIEYLRIKIGHAYDLHQLLQQK